MGTIAGIPAAMGLFGLLHSSRILTILVPPILLTLVGIGFSRWNWMAFKPMRFLPSLLATAAAWLLLFWGYAMLMLLF